MAARKSFTSEKVIKEMGSSVIATVHLRLEWGSGSCEQKREDVQSVWYLQPRKRRASV
jgi:hypothetical protein